MDGRHTVDCIACYTHTKYSEEPTVLIHKVTAGTTRSLLLCHCIMKGVAKL